jgi:xanthine/uracil permease
MIHEADAGCHFLASTIAAVVNFPLWRASAIAQSGFKLEGSNFIVRYYQAAVKPPFKGLTATICGMAWARGAIFYGSERGKHMLLDLGFYGLLAQTLPPLVIGTIVQCINMPLVRATITIQNPKCELENVSSALRYIYNTRGIEGMKL